VHQLALFSLAIAGFAYCAAAVRRWSGLVAEPGTSAPLVGWLLGLGFGALTVALVSSLLEGGSRDFAYAVLGGWAATAALHFALGFLAAPTRGLLVLPVGCLALLLALAGLAEPAPVSEASSRAVVILHSVCMAVHLAVALVAGGAGGLYLLAVRQLKRASPRAFRLPPLPLLERVSERALVIAMALLMAGLATGGAAITASHAIRLSHPSVVIAFVSLTLLVVMFALRLAGHVGRRGMALLAVQTMVLAALSAVGLQVVAHG
jgi:hypothetical protein